MCSAVRPVRCSAVRAAVAAEASLTAAAPCPGPAQLSSAGKQGKAAQHSTALHNAAVSSAPQCSAGRWGLRPVGKLRRWWQCGVAGLAEWRHLEGSPPPCQPSCGPGRGRGRAATPRPWGAGRGGRGGECRPGRAGGAPGPSFPPVPINSEEIAAPRPPATSHGALQPRPGRE